MLLRIAMTRLSSPADAEDVVQEVFLKLLTTRPHFRDLEHEKAWQALPAKYSAVIHLYYYEGYSIKEISKLLQIPLPTVGTRLSRGRERLRQLLKEDVE